jgi:hypothetical protein
VTTSADSGDHPAWSTKQQASPVAVVRFVSPRPGSPANHGRPRVPGRASGTAQLTLAQPRPVLQPSDEGGEQEDLPEHTPPAI